MPLIPDIKIRGIRTPIPSGYVLGRTQAGHGDVHLIPIDKLGGVASAGAGGGGGGGGGSTSGGVASVGGGVVANSAAATIAANALQLAQMGASNYGSGEAEGGGDIAFIGLPGATGATGAASTVPGPTGSPGVALDGVDGEDGLPIPGSIGATGATGAASTVPGPTGPPGIALDGIDGEDGLPIPGPTGSSGAFTAVCFCVNKNGSNQTGIASAVFTQITFGTELYDVGNYFASSAWVPPAGKVHMDAKVYGTGTIANNANCALAIYKNGVVFAQSNHPGETSQVGLTVSGDDIANGTDSYTVYAFVTSTGTWTASGTISLTTFSGFLLTT